MTPHASAHSRHKGFFGQSFSSLPAKKKNFNYQSVLNRWMDCWIGRVGRFCHVFSPSTTKSGRRYGVMYVSSSWGTRDPHWTPLWPQTPLLWDPWPWPYIVMWWCDVITWGGVGCSAFLRKRTCCQKDHWNLWHLYSTSFTGGGGVMFSKPCSPSNFSSVICL